LPRRPAVAAARPHNRQHDAVDNGQIVNQKWFRSDDRYVAFSRSPAAFLAKLKALTSVSFVFIGLASTNSLNREPLTLRQGLPFCSRFRGFRGQGVSGTEVTTIGNAAHLQRLVRMGSTKDK
jgi:hypothetical protein